jgi:sulfate/thiosulfate transport system substrate-binding protein
VNPSVSIVAEPSVAVVDKVADKKGTRELATAYLKHLYSDEGQKLVAKHYYRPRDWTAPAVSRQFPKITLFTIDEVFGGWQKAQQAHFADGGTFDQIYRPAG